MIESYLKVEHAQPLSGVLEVAGAKNAVLVIMASLLLVDGKSTLRNVPASSDVWLMKLLLEEIGAVVEFDVYNHILTVDTSGIHCWQVNQLIMKKMRASILLAGPLLVRFGKADVAVPGGCVLGARSLDFHINNFKKMGTVVEQDGHFLKLKTVQPSITAAKLILEYPSVGATENLLMAAVGAHGSTTIVNAALEPEVIDLITVLKKMGAAITIQPPATIVVEGGMPLTPIDHTIIPDRLEAGSLLLAAAVTGGSLYLKDMPESMLDLFLYKLKEMGHSISIGDGGVGIHLVATARPQAVSFKTGPFPSFPTDLQAPMMLAQAIAEGSCIIEETVFESRLGHVDQLIKMGANIDIINNMSVKVKGVKELIGGQVQATDIRASCALVLAGLVAHGTTYIAGVHHWKRGYESLDLKLNSLGAHIEIFDECSSISIKKEDFGAVVRNF